jgi:RHS repeat-associated protein
VDSFYHKDDMGNVLALTDKDGAVVEYYEYTDYGYPTIYAPNGTVRTVSAVGNTLMWGARPWDREAGLYYFRYRWYDPYLGRFITRDPIGIWGDGISNGNGYAYVGNNPWSMVDPFGLSCKRRVYEWHHGFAQEFLTSDSYAGLRERIGWQNAKTGVFVKLTDEQLSRMANSSRFGTMIRGGIHQSIHAGGWNEDLAKRLEEIAKKNNGKLTPGLVLSAIEEQKFSAKYKLLFEAGEAMKAIGPYSKWKNLSKEEKRLAIQAAYDSMPAVRRAAIATAAKEARVVLRKQMLKTNLKRGGKAVGKTLGWAAFIFTINSTAAAYQEGGAEAAACEYTGLSDARAIATEGSEAIEDVLLDSDYLGTPGIESYMENIDGAMEVTK